jgi:haloacetate dehalogenase
MLGELNRSTYSSAKSDTDRLRVFFGRGFCGKYHHDEEDSMERRTVLEGITAATLSALSPPALKRFTLGQHANVPVAFDFQTTEIKTSDNTVFIRPYGQGPALLMVHGFPRTSLMWRYVAPRLAKNYAVICVDLRGYGRSGIPASTEDHYPYTKRAMANELVEVMTKLGFPRFSVESPIVSHSIILKKSTGLPYFVPATGMRMDLFRCADVGNAGRSRGVSSSPRRGWSLLCKAAPRQSQALHIPARKSNSSDP